MFSNARRLDVLRTHVFNTVIFSLMEIRLMAHGTYRSHFIYSGSNGTASVTVDITVCYLEKKTDRNLATNLKSIMESGHSSACMGSRYIEVLLQHEYPDHLMLAFSFCYLGSH